MDKQVTKRITKKSKNNSDKSNLDEDDVKGKYIESMEILLNVKKINIKHGMGEIINYLHNKNDSDKFIILMHDIYEAFNDDNNKEYIEKLFSESSLEEINNISTHKLCPYKNQPILEMVMKKEQGKNIEYNNLTTDYICKKCKCNKTVTKFVHRRLGLDENSDTIANCIQCGYSWKI